jgi:hypothetical protein
LAPKLDERGGISAVLLPGEIQDSTVLDLAAVLEGLVGARFEIILVCNETPAWVADVHARAPSLPLRVQSGVGVSAGCDAAAYELILVAAGDGQFDVRELNHLLEAIERGADVAAGYRPRRMDGLVRQFQRLGWKVEVDCAFVLLRRNVWQELARTPQSTWCCAELLARVRRLGFRVTEVPVSHRRPTIGAQVSRVAA